MKKINYTKQTRVYTVKTAQGIYDIEAESIMAAAQTAENQFGGFIKVLLVKNA